MMEFRRFIVTGSWCEKLAVLHIMARCEKSALACFYLRFGTLVRGFDVHVTDLKSRPDMDQFWRGNSYSSYSGSYIYV